MKVEKEDKRLYPLTHPQKRIWYIEKMYPNTSLYNIGGTVIIKGNINIELLQQAIITFIKKNEGIRLKILEKDGWPLQYIDRFKDDTVDYVDFTNGEEPEIQFKKWVQNHASKPFLLQNSRLFYFALYKISDNCMGYLIKLHHIIADGWSIQILTSKIMDYYLRLCNDECINNEIEYTYIHYIEKEKQYLTSRRFIRNQLFWNKEFETLSDLTMRPSSEGIIGNRKSYTVNYPFTKKIKEYCKKNNISLNTLFVTLYLIYDSRVTGQNDRTIGVPVFNRSNKKEKQTFGMFTSTMPFRFQVDTNQSFQHILKNVQEKLMIYYMNQKYPYDLLVQDLEIKKKGYDHLFNVCINYYNTTLHTSIDGNQIENVEFYNGNQAYSLQIIIREWSDSGCLVLDFDYKISDYSDKQLNGLYTNLMHMLDGMIANPVEAVKTHNLLSAKMKEHFIYTVNNTMVNYPRDKVIHELFQEQVERHANKIAISDYDFYLSYRELNNKSNQLARYLIRKGVGQENIVGLLMSHCAEAVIAILAILKAGGSYLPIDPTYPEQRVQYILEDSKSNIIITNLTVPDSINFEGKIVNFNREWVYEGETSNIENRSKSNQLAYIIYTSGTSGKPKGTMIGHQGLVNYIWWAKKEYITEEQEVFPLYSSLGFDLTITSIFTPLISGHKIVVYQNDNNEDSYVLYRILDDGQATMIKLTPSHLALLKDRDYKHSSIKKFIIGGEELKVSLVKDIYNNFHHDLMIYNEYGPTETVIGCMIHQYSCQDDELASVPIGHAINNMQIYILDKEFQPMPIGEIGELYISGDGVARGYLNNQLLTASKFIENPFIEGTVMYKTGDLARYVDEKRMEYVGRIDDQVKIRGYRIELGEIEKCLLSYRGIQEASVQYIDNRGKGQYLCAYIISKVDVVVKDVKSYLLKRLPDYMVPLYIIKLDKMPLTDNGKINKEKLSILIPQEDKIEYVKHRDHQEKVLSAALCKVFGMNKLSMKQNFYHMGGDSIKAIQIASILHDQGYKIKIKDILAFPIFEDMATCIEKNNDEINQEICTGDFPPTPIASWFLQQSLANPHYYHQSILVDIKIIVERLQLERIWNELIKHHDTLRMNVDSEGGELFYNPKHLAKQHTIQEHKLGHLSQQEQNTCMIRIAEELKAGFDIHNDILIKACIYDLGNIRQLLITAHHLVIDGVSWRIILDDLNRMIEQVITRKPIVLPPKTHSYKKWADTLATRGIEMIRKEKTYWNRIKKNKKELPLKASKANSVINAKPIEIELSNETTTLLLGEANKVYNTTTEQLLITSLLRSIKQMTNNQHITIELEGHGREEVFDNINMTRTVGWFTSIYPFYVDLYTDNLSIQIKEVKEQLKAIPHRGIGYGILNYIEKSIENPYHEAIRFNYLGSFMNDGKMKYLEIVDKQLGDDSSKNNKLTALIEVNVYNMKNRLKIRLAYNSKKLDDTMIKHFLDNYISHIERIIDHCSHKKKVEFTPSDFDTVELSQDELDSLIN